GAAARAADLYSGEASFRRAQAGFAADAFHLGGWDLGDLLSETGAIAHPDVGVADAVAAKVVAASAVLGRTTALAAEGPPDSPQLVPAPTNFGPSSGSADLQLASHKRNFFPLATGASPVFAVRRRGQPRLYRRLRLTDSRSRSTAPAVRQRHRNRRITRRSAPAPADRRRPFPAAPADRATEA